MTPRIGTTAMRIMTKRRRLSSCKNEPVANSFTESNLPIFRILSGELYRAPTGHRSTGSSRSLTLSRLGFAHPAYGDLRAVGSTRSIDSHGHAIDRRL